MESKIYDLFISYKSENLNLASQLYERLAYEGFSVWFDKARLNPGCQWHIEIEEGCEASRIILPVLTPTWKESEWTKFETYGAEFVIPLLCKGNFEDAAPLPLREYQFLDFRQPDEESWNRLFASIRQYLRQEPHEKTQRLAFIPYAHNPYFVGREKSLLDIHEKLCRAPSTALTQVTAQAVSGLGGVGKTTLAREYAEKFWRLYCDILWVRADRPLALEFQRLAQELGLISERSQVPEDDARRAMQELSSRTRRLLIMDNAPDEESIQKWIPTTGHCRTLITSRFAGWSVAVQNIQVDVLELGPARELLLRRSGMPDSKENRAAADRLAQELGFLPLALEHAAAFVREASISFDQYLAYYSETRSRRDLTAQRVLGSTQYPESVATTWLVTIERLRPLARSILKLISFLVPDDIPRSIVKEAGDFLREGVLEIQPANEQDGIETSAYALDQALTELKGFSMVSLQQESLSVHRMVQAVQRDGLSDLLHRRWAERAVRAVNEVFPAPEYFNWPSCNRLIPHAQTLAPLIDQYGFDFPEASLLLNQAGYYLNERAQYAEAEPLFARALAIREKAPRAEHPDVATSLNNLALLYYNQGKYAEAEPLFARALAIVEKALGAEHPYVATSLNNLAALYNNQGKYAEAEPLYRRALAIVEKASGAEHQYVAHSLNNLAEIYRNQGKYAEAESLYERALAIYEKALGAEHPSVATSLNNLALLYYNQGKYAEAEPLFAQALDIYEKAVGAEHPDLANSLSNLAALYHNQGKNAEAEPLYRRALTILEKAFGAEHPNVATVLRNYSSLLRATDKESESPCGGAA
jgi:tetratricopeptide (TPR) repeat protein